MLITLTLMKIIRVISRRDLACIGLDLYILILVAICGSAVNRCFNSGGGDFFQNFGA